jgi:hypothetical protein
MPSSSNVEDAASRSLLACSWVQDGRGAGVVEDYGGLSEQAHAVEPLLIERQEGEVIFADVFERMPGGVQATECRIKMGLYAAEDASRRVINDHAADRGLDPADCPGELAEGIRLDAVAGDRHHRDWKLAGREGGGYELASVGEPASGQREQRTGYSGLVEVEWLLEAFSERRHRVDVALRAVHISEDDSNFESDQMAM